MSMLILSKFRVHRHKQQPSNITRATRSISHDVSRHARCPDIWSEVPSLCEREWEEPMDEMDDETPVSLNFLAHVAADTIFCNRSLSIKALIIMLPNTSP